MEFLEFLLGEPVEGDEMAAEATGRGLVAGMRGELPRRPPLKTPFCFNGRDVPSANRLEASKAWLGGPGKPLARTSSRVSAVVSLPNLAADSTNTGNKTFSSKGVVELPMLSIGSQTALFGRSQTALFGAQLLSAPPKAAPSEEQPKAAALAASGLSAGELNALMCSPLATLGVDSGSGAGAQNLMRATIAGQSTKRMDWNGAEKSYKVLFGASVLNRVEGQLLESGVDVRGCAVKVLGPARPTQTRKPKASRKT